MNTHNHPTRPGSIPRTAKGQIFLVQVMEQGLTCTHQVLSRYVDSEQQQALNNAAPVKRQAVLERGQKQNIQDGGKGSADDQPYSKLVSTVVLRTH